MAEQLVPPDHEGEPDHLVEAGGLTFLGLQGMLDPPRESVIDAVAGCRRAGIRPIMITGDHALAAAIVAAHVGITDDAESVLTGLDLDKLTNTQLADAVKTESVFARVSPEHKLRIVQARAATVTSWP